MTPPPPVRVFVSYAHDSEEHKERVRALCDRLRGEGIDCMLDQYIETPEFGWPRWMSDQIEDSTFVLIVASPGYTDRLAKLTIPGVGAGVAWEAQLVTQTVYDDKGRNLKFVPVVLRQEDLREIPRFLQATTHYSVNTERDYESLYRRLTSQPAIVMPPLGPLRALEKKEAPKTEEFYENIALRDRSVIWLLPRGFLLLEHLTANAGESWAVIASHYRYDGNWVHSTHFHSSYENSWWDRPNGIDIQCRKLGVPIADRRFVDPALRFMCDVRNEKITFGEELAGDFDGEPFNSGIAQVCGPGKIRVLAVPPSLEVLAHLGPLRDLAVEAEDLSKTKQERLAGLEYVPNIEVRAQRLKRETRLALSLLFDATHPVQENIRELLVRLDGCIGPDRQKAWAEELATALDEGLRFELDRPTKR